MARSMIAILDRWARIRACKLSSQDHDPLSWEWVSIPRPDLVRWLARYQNDGRNGVLGLDVCPGNNEGHIVRVTLDGHAIVKVKTFVGFSAAWELGGMLLGALTRYHARGPAPAHWTVRTREREWVRAEHGEAESHSVTGRPRMRMCVSQERVLLACENRSCEVDDDHDDHDARSDAEGRL